MTKQGLGYVGIDVSAGLHLAIDRLHESRGELSGELLVERVPEGHLLRGRFNVSSMETRKRWALQLNAIANGVDWREVLEHFCLRVLDQERAGEPFTTVGNRPARAEVPYLLAPILRRGSPTILFGEGGSGKSLLAAAAVVTVASGVSVLRDWVIEEPGRVLVLDWESDEDDWNERIGLIAAGVGIEPPEVLYRHGGGIGLVDQVESLAQQVAQQDVALLVVDSVGMASPLSREGVDANDTTLRLFKALARIGTTSLLIDHVSKAGAERESGAVRPYGSIFKVNLARSVYELRVGQQYAGQRHLALVHRKVNRGPTQDPVGLVVEYGARAINFYVEEVRSPELVRSMPPWMRIQALLEEVGPMKPADIARELDIAANKVRSYLQRHEVFHRWDDGRYTAVSAYFPPSGATPATAGATTVALPPGVTVLEGGNRATPGTPATSATLPQQPVAPPRNTGPLLRRGAPGVAGPSGRSGSSGGTGVREWAGALLPRRDEAEMAHAVKAWASDWKRRGRRVRGFASVCGLNCTTDPTLPIPGARCHNCLRLDDDSAPSQPTEATEAPETSRAAADPEDLEF